VVGRRQFLDLDRLERGGRRFVAELSYEFDVAPNFGEAEVRGPPQRV
jgi:hypothetical protein